MACSCHRRIREVAAAVRYLRWTRGRQSQSNRIEVGFQDEDRPQRDHRLLRKARFEAKRFSQVPGSDVSDAYAPVAQRSTLQAVMALAAKPRLPDTSTIIGVQTAFLQSNVDETIYHTLSSRRASSSTAETAKNSYKATVYYTLSSVRPPSPPISSNVEWNDPQVAEKQLFWCQYSSPVPIHQDRRSPFFC